MADLRVRLFDMLLNNPIMPAAGPPVKDGQAAQKAKEGGAGAIVTKTVSLKSARVPRPNMAQIRGGFLNTELWSELTLEQWLEVEYPLAVKTGLPVIISLGYSAEEIGILAQKVKPYAAALELSTHYLGNDPTPIIESIKAAKKVVDIPVMVKLSPQVDIPRFAQAAEKAGADGLVLINSFGPVLDIDVKNGQPLLGSENGYGWLSGDAIFPLALKSVYEAAQSVDIPIIGVGGISKGSDVIKMIMAGALAVQVCTAAILKGSGIYHKIMQEMSEIMDNYKYSTLKEIRGIAQTKLKNKKANFTTIVPKVDKEACTGCGLCIDSCIYNALRFAESKQYVIIDKNKCAGCGLCTSRCNFNALQI